MRTFYFLALMALLLFCGSVRAQGIACPGLKDASSLQTGADSGVEEALKQAVVAAGKAYGPNHPAVASCLDTLAALYVRQGRYAQAGPLYKRSLAIYRSALGHEYAPLASTLDSLAAPAGKAGRERATGPAAPIRIASAGGT